MNNIPKNRGFLKSVAYLQIIGIILVVLGHSMHEYPDGDMGRSTLLYRMFYSFRMPLFMFVSGFLMYYTAKQTHNGKVATFSEFTRRKVERLLLPFIVLTLIVFVPRGLMSGMADDVVELSIDSFWKAFVYSEHIPIPYFWFLQASFILLVFNYIVITLGEKAHINSVILFASIILLFLFLQFLPVDFGSAFSLNQVVRLGVYFVLGCTYARFIRTVDNVVPWTSIPFFLGSVALWAVLFFLTEKTGWIALCSLTGITMCISLSKIMEARDIRFIDHLIGANYMIFLLSWFCNVASQQILHHFTEFPWWVYSTLSLVSGVYVPWLCYRYLCAHPDSRWVRVAAVLLGQSLRKRRD
ncbi:MAG: acyltransferase [Duncaniella sp.]|nr:acyltransferase [Duncaniella sp.]